MKSFSMCFILAVLRNGEAASLQKRNSEQEPKICCFPGKYAIKSTTFSQELDTRGGKVDENSYTSSRYEIVDGGSKYVSPVPKNYFNLKVSENNLATIAAYINDSKCFEVKQVEDYGQYDYGKCFDPPYVGKEVKDGKSYSVFRTYREGNYTDMKGWFINEIYAIVDKDGGCMPKYSLFGLGRAYHAGGNFTSYLHTMYEEQDFGPEQEALLQIPPSSQRCKF